MISFPQPEKRGSSIKWRFFDYGKEIQIWYDGLTEDEQETLIDLLKLNGKADTPAGWIGWKMLTGEGKEGKIWEWRFHPSGVQQRLLGVFGIGRREAVFLVGCNHKQRVYQPRDCIKTAVKRAKEVRLNKAKLNERQVPEDI